MLSLLNKSGGDKAALQSIPWRPDFRDLSQLPDTKTVRTAFFVNVVAIAIAGGLALYFGQCEWEAAGLKGSLAEVEKHIVAATPASEKAQATYKLFQAEEAKFKEAYGYVSDPFRLQNLLMHLGLVLPPDVTVRRVDFRGLGQTVVLTGSIKGLDAAASDAAARFVKQLQSDAELAKYFTSIELTNLGRNAEAASLNLELVFSFKKPAVKPAAAKKSGAKKGVAEK
jgi:hypothetical protein